MTRNLYELSELVDKKFANGEDIPQNIIESIKNITQNKN